MNAALRAWRAAAACHAAAALVDCGDNAMCIVCCWVHPGCLHVASAFAPQCRAAAACHAAAAFMDCEYHVVGSYSYSTKISFIKGVMLGSISLLP